MEPGASAAARAPGFFERRRRRAQLREQLAVREEMLLELGALVFELHRQGQRAPELLQTRAAELDAVDSEVRAMQAALEHGDESAWPAAPAAAPAWDETGEWDGADEPGWGETGEWETTGRTGEWSEAAAGQETGEWAEAAAGQETTEWAEAAGEGEWVDPAGESEWADPAEQDLGETQEWSVAEALAADDVTADPHDPSAEDAVEVSPRNPDDPSAEDTAEGAPQNPDDPIIEERP